MNIDRIKEFLSTLFFSWGSEAPAEATWAGNSFLCILEEKYNYKFRNHFSESYDEEFPDNNYEPVLKEIKDLLCI